MYYDELSAMRDTLRSHTGIYYDTSSLFFIEDIIRDFGPDRMVYGSQYPLLCLKSTLLLIKNADLDDSIKKKILVTNGANLIQGGGFSA